MSLFPFSAEIEQAKESQQPTKEENTEEFSQYLELKGYKSSTIKNATKAIKAYQNFIKTKPNENYLNYLKHRAKIIPTRN
jgi:cytochrome c peroxidase